MRIAVVDDEAPQRKSLLELLRRWAEGKPDYLDGQMEYSAFSSGAAFLAAQPRLFDLVFLDIYMPNENGIEIAARLRALHRSCRIVFLTSSENHRSEAFAVHAFDYLVKPVQEERLFCVMEDILSELPALQPTLKLTVERMELALSYGDICCILADSQYCVVYTGEIFRSRVTFGSLVKQLSEEPRFLVINRGILINMDYVLQMENRVCRMKNGMQLPVNTRSFHALRQTLTNYRFSRRANHLNGRLPE